MWIYFNKNGIEQISLTHGTPARQGESNDFEIFAYFDGINLDNTEATIEFMRPDKSVVGVSFVMEKKENKLFTLLPEEKYVAPFENGKPYTGYSFINKDANLFNMYGIWKATIRIYNAKQIKAVGIIKFNVEQGVVIDDYDINTNQFNELMQLISTKYGLGTTLKLVDQLPEISDAKVNVIYAVKQIGSDVRDMYFWNGTNDENSFIYIGSTTLNLDNYIPKVEKGMANGVVPLNQYKKIDTKYLNGNFRVEIFGKYNSENSFTDDATGQEAKKDVAYLYIDITTIPYNEYVWVGNKYIKLLDQITNANEIVYSTINSGLPSNIANVQSAIDFIISYNDNVNFDKYTFLDFFLNGTNLKKSTITLLNFNGTGTIVGRDGIERTMSGIAYALPIVNNENVYVKVIVIGGTEHGKDIYEVTTENGEVYCDVANNNFKASDISYDTANSGLPSEIVNVQNALDYTIAKAGSNLAFTSDTWHKLFNGDLPFAIITMFNFTSGETIGQDGVNRFMRGNVIGFLDRENEKLYLIGNGGNGKDMYVITTKNGYTDFYCDVANSDIFNNYVKTINLDDNFDANLFTPEFAKSNVAIGKISNAQNTPEPDFSKNGNLEVIKYNDTTFIQIWHAIDDYAFIGLFVRGHDGNGFSKWFRITDDLVLRQVLKSYAKIDGDYINLTSGMSHGLLDNSNKDTPNQVNQDFSTRITANGDPLEESSPDTKASLLSVKGQTIAFNQWTEKINIIAPQPINGITFEKVGDYKLKFNGTTTAYTDINRIISLNVKYSRLNHIIFIFNNANRKGSDDTFSTRITNGSARDYGEGAIEKFNRDQYYISIRFFCQANVDLTGLEMNFFFVDLTQMYGITEVIPLTDPRITWLKSYLALHPEFNEGTLINSMPTRLTSFGANLWNGNLIQGGLYSNGTTPNDNPNEIRTDYIPTANQTYIRTQFFEYTLNRDTTQMKIFRYNANKELVSTERHNFSIFRWVLTKDVCFVRFVFENVAVGGTLSPNEISEMNITFETHDTFIPYVEPDMVETHYDKYFTSIINGKKYVIMAGVGSVHDEITKTKAIKRFGMVDLGTLNWEKNSDGAIKSGSISSLIKKPFGSTSIWNARCSNYNATTEQNSYANPNEKSICCTFSGTLALFDSSIIDSDIDSQGKIAKLNGVMLAYELAEPKIRTHEPLDFDYNAYRNGIESWDNDGTNPLVDIHYYINLRDKLVSLRTAKEQKDIDDTQNSKISSLETNLTNLVNSKGQANGFVPLDENKLIPDKYIAGLRDYVVKASLEELNQIPVSERKETTVYIAADTNTEYVWSDSTQRYLELNYAHPMAEQVSYDNTTSGITATDVQAAIDEVSKSNNAAIYLDEANIDEITSYNYPEKTFIHIKKLHNVPNGFGGFEDTTDCIVVLMLLSSVSPIVIYDQILFKANMFMPDINTTDKDVLGLFHCEIWTRYRYDIKDMPEFNLDAKWYKITYNEDLKSYAKNDGSYINMTVGNAEGLIDPRGKDTPTQVNQDFSSRVTANGATIEGSSPDTKASLLSVKGQTIAFNQLIKNQFDTSITSYWTKNRMNQVNENGIATFMPTSNEYDYVGFYRLFRQLTGDALIPNHKYYALISLQNVNANIKEMSLSLTGGASITIKNPNINTWYDVETIGEVFKSSIFYSISFRYNSTNDIKINQDVFEAKKPHLVDLTLCYGVGNEPTSVDDPRIVELKRLLALYPDYTVGTLINSMPTRLTSYGPNLCDQEFELGTISTDTGENRNDNETLRSKNYYSILPSKLYSLKVFNDFNYSFIGYLFYDKNKNYLDYFSISKDRPQDIPSLENARYVRIFFANIDTGIIPNNPKVLLNLNTISRESFIPYIEPDIVEIPDVGGLNGVGTAHDEITKDKYIKRFEEVDLGSLSWEVTGKGTENERFDATLSLAKDNEGSFVIPNIICDRITISNFESVINHTNDKIITLYSGELWLYDSALIGKTGEQIKAYFNKPENKTYLRYELATPVITTHKLDFEYNAYIGGIEAWTNDGVNPLADFHYYMNLREKVISLRSRKEQEDIDNEQDRRIEIIENSTTSLESDKVNLFTYATGAGGLVQEDAKLLLQNYDNYEGKLIEFYANETAPDKLVSMGFVVKGLDDSKRLIEIDRDGRVVKWTETSNQAIGGTIERGLNYSTTDKPYKVTLIPAQVNMMKGLKIWYEFYFKNVKHCTMDIIEFNDKSDADVWFGKVMPSPNALSSDLALIYKKSTGELRIATSAEDQNLVPSNIKIIDVKGIM